MLYYNNTNGLSLKTTSGVNATINAGWNTRSWYLTNAARHGQSVSIPQGYNQLGVSIVPPIQTGGNIATRYIPVTDMLADLKATGILAANLDAETTYTVVGNMVANIYAELDVEGSLTCDLKATGNLSTDFDILARPSAFDIAQEVWNATASGYNNVGTMGEKVNDAGSGSNPWTEVIESGLTAAEILRLIAAVQFGKSDISGSTITFRDVGDTKNRVSATMTGSERTSITLDGA